jgi:hypothetical protein
MRPASWSLALLVSLAGCKSAPTESTSTTITTSTMGSMTGSGLSAVQGAPVGGGDIAWTMPASWTTEPSSGMRKASYRIAKVAGDKEDATVSVIQAGGSVDGNVARWKSQFDGAHDFSRTDNKVGDLPVTIVEVHGTYTGGGVMVGESPDPRLGWALVGAIVPTREQAYFFKMLGPDKTVAAARHDFQTLVDSVHTK